MKSRRTLVAALAALVLSAVLVEVGACALVEGGVLSTPRPRRGAQGFWRGDHPQFGVWHAPESRYLHRKKCFATQYQTNSLGARDRERSRRSSQPRVVVLGDSFLEGWGVPTAQRLSNLLELATGQEHLNFAMAHFGPYQAYLVYRSLAREFDHQAVLLGILPSNDFADLDLDLARAVEGYTFRYRPYLMGEAPDFRHVDHREARPRRALRTWSYAGNALLAVLERRRAGRLREEMGRDVDSALPRSYFYDYRESDVARLEAILERLAREASGKRLAIVLIPTIKDFKRYQVSGEDPLSRRLQETGDRLGFQVVSLLGPMGSRTRNWPRYFFDCDYHWNEFGNATAKELLLEALGAEFYQRRRP